MQVSVEAPSKLERKMTVVVPVEQVKQAFDKRIASRAKKAKIDGFRPGKVPVNIILQRFGDSALQEARSDVIQSSLYEALDQEKLFPVATPQVEPTVMEDDKPLEYVVTFEVAPEVDNVKLDLTSFEKQTASIQDEDIDKVLNHLEMQHQQWKKVDRAAKDKDQVILDFSGSIDGVIFPGGEAHAYPIVIGSNTMIPGFEEGIVGINAGEEKVLKITFPETYFAKEVAGKEAEFKVKAITVSEPKPLNYDEAFIKRLGIKDGSLESLRSEIRRNLERECDRVIKLKLKNQVFDILLEQNPIEVPKSLVEQEAARIHDEVHPHHGQQHHHTAEENESFAKMGERNVKLGLLVRHLIADRKVVPNKDKINAQIASMASAYENPAEVINWYKNDKKAYSQVEAQVLEDQLIETLLENVQIKEKNISYNELVKNQSIG